MPRRSQQRARAMRYAERRSQVKSDITVRDYIRLKNELCSRPDRIFDYFESCHVSCLMDLPLFLEIVQDRPEAAAKIVLVAATRGIPVHPPKSEGNAA